MIVFDPKERTTESQYRLGRVDQHDDCNFYIYVKAAGAIDADDLVRIDQTNLEVTASGHNTGKYEDRFGVATEAFAAGEYGWVAVYGRLNVNAKADCGIQRGIYPAGTAGHVDDAKPAGGKTLHGIVVTAARGAGDGPTACQLSWPRQID